MHRNSARTLAMALLLGTALAGVGLVGTGTEAQAAGAPKITNKAVGEPLQEAMGLHGRGQISQAIAKAREARGAAGITGAETALIDQLIASWLLQAKDYRGALTAYESLIDRGVGNRQQNLQAALGLALQLNQTAKAQQFASQLGGAGAAGIFIAQAEYNAGRYDEAIRLARPLAQGNPPSQQALQVLSASYFAKKDMNGFRGVQEQLLQHYPSPKAWSDMIRLTRNTKGLTDNQQLELYRLRLNVGDMIRAEDFMEMAQLALITGYPAEAKMVADKGVAAKLLQGDRAQRLSTMINQRVAQDAAAVATLQKQAAADPTGNADVKYGLTLLSQGKAAEAQAAIAAGIQKGKVTDMGAAQTALGRAFLAQGKKAEAQRAFNAVPRNTPQGSIARLWSIYAQRA
jgi:tetratricopeptide (TPR) repeat protein